MQFLLHLIVLQPIRTRTITPKLVPSTTIAPPLLRASAHKTYSILAVLIFLLLVYRSNHQILMKQTKNNKSNNKINPTLNPLDVFITFDD